MGGMRDASIILLLVLLWQSGWFFAAAIRYAIADGEPMPFRRRFGWSLLCYLVPVLLLYAANGSNFNHRQLWLAGSFNFTARLLPRSIEHLPAMCLALIGLFLLIEFTLRITWRKRAGSFLSELLAFSLWVTILVLAATVAPQCQALVVASLQFGCILLLLALPPVAILCGIWSGNSRIIYTMMAIFIAGQILLALIGYLMFSRLFIHEPGLAAGRPPESNCPWQQRMAASPSPLPASRS